MNSSSYVECFKFYPQIVKLQPGRWILTRPWQREPFHPCSPKILFCLCSPESCYICFILSSFNTFASHKEGSLTVAPMGRTNLEIRGSTWFFYISINVHLFFIAIMNSLFYYWNKCPPFFVINVYLFFIVINVHLFFIVIINSLFYY